MKRRGMWMVLVAAMVVGVPGGALGQQAKPDAVALANEALRLMEEAIHLYGEGKYDAAIPLAERARAMVEQVYRPNHPNVGAVLDNLAVIYLAKGDFAKAEPLYLRALAIKEEALGPDHLGVATVVNNLAGLYTDKGDYVRAEPLYVRALAIREKELDPKHPDVGKSLNNLAELYKLKGDYAKAEPLCLRALALREEALGKEHPEVAASLINLGALYQAKGAYRAAEEQYQRSIKILQTHEPDHLNLATARNNLAELYRTIGAYMPAEPLYVRALEITINVLGPDHQMVAVSLNNLALLYHAIGDYARAEPLYQRALEISEKSVGPDHPAVAQSLNNLAELCKAKGEYARSERLYQRAQQALEKTLGRDHPHLAHSLNNSATLYWAQNNAHRALSTLEQGISIEDRNAAHELAVGTDESRRAYMSRLGGTTSSAITLHLQYSSSVENAKHLALRTILRRKGLVLDAMANSFANLREHVPFKWLPRFDEWRDLTAQYSALVRRGPDQRGLEAHRTLVQNVNEKRLKLENELSLVSQDLKAQLKPVEIEQIQSALPQNAALVELVRYEPLNPKAKGTENLWGTPRFAAYVLHPNGKIDFADLGEAKPIEDAAKSLRNVLSNERTDPKPAGRELYNRVMAPIIKLLGQTRYVFLSPDGELSLIPFGALVTPNDEYLAQSLAITYLTTGRDLVRPNTGQPRQSATILTAPNYQLGAPAKPPVGHFYESITGVLDEGKTVQTTLGDATLIHGNAATESALKEVHGPRVLHISTHGFFEKNLPALHEPPRDAFQNQLQPPPPVENALLRSGLALAGANVGGINEVDNGLLTALEASQLDLWGTKLVVLSACETGQGQAEYGDGVYGLRRAFAMAGAETVVMSLWKVEPNATTELFTRYYNGLSHRGGRAESLRQAQLAMLANPQWQHPMYWASFIVSGNDSAMDGQKVEPTFGRVNPGARGCACEMGASGESAPWGWIGIAIAGAGLVSRRRKTNASWRPIHGA